MVKSTQNNPQKNSFVLSVFRRIESEGRLPSAKGLNCSNSNITYHARKLMTLGIIKKVDNKAGIYKSLVSEKEAINRLKSYTKRILVTTKTTTIKNLKYKRVHSIQGKLILPKFDYWYNILKKYLDKKELPYEVNRKNQIKVTMLNDDLKHTFLLCKDCIIFYLPNGKDFISDDVDFAMDLAKVYCNELLSKFSAYFGKDLRIKGEFKYIITRKHIAMMNNTVAKTMRKKKNHLQVWVNGKLRLISDNSFNFDELEAISNTNAVTDVKKVELMLKDVIENGHTISDIKELVNNESRSLYHSIQEMQKTIKAQNELLSLVIKDKGFNHGEFYK